MGDIKRNPEFATWIRKQFPKVKTILVIADGKGGTARSLANKGFIVRIIENCPRWEGKPHKNVVYEKGWFTSETIIEEDLIIGMHPDEATGEIMLAAKNQNKPFAVVPCCAVGIYSENLGKIDYVEWIKRLTKTFKAESLLLKITGRNIVLFKKDWKS